MKISRHGVFAKLCVLLGQRPCIWDLRDQLCIWCLDFQAEIAKYGEAHEPSHKIGDHPVIFAVRIIKHFSTEVAK